MDFSNFNGQEEDLDLSFLKEFNDEKGHFKDLGDYHSLSELNDNSLICCKDLLWSNLYIDDLLNSKGQSRPDGNLRNELIEIKQRNIQEEKDHNKLLMKIGGLGIVVSGVVMGGMLINNHINKRENHKEIKEREDLKELRKSDIYKFGDKFKDSGKVINGVGKFIGKGVFGFVNLMDKLKI